MDLGLHLPTVEDGFKYLRYEAVTLDRMPHRHVGVDLIVIAPALPLKRQVAGVPQVSDDPLNRALGDSHFCRQVSHPHRRVFGDADQHVSMVREKGPPAACA